jgi:hypothetical protein
MQRLIRRIWKLSLAVAWLGAAWLVVPARADDPPSAADYDGLISPSQREHWAFQPAGTFSVPSVRETSWVRNPIDAFILAPLEKKGWRPNPPAKPQALVRRMYLDLVGLPPTLAEQSAFMKDPSPAAFDGLADELLSRPAYGERWGRHWLDLVRYAESNGYERDGAKPSVWRYRDYVIRSFNADKPYDRFLLEQLAGDELPDASTETVTALGYYRLGPWDDEPADPVEDRFDQLDDIVATTAQVFLGLTLQCARCHNHKFEPLTTLDYYRLTAIFNPLQRFQDGRSDLDAPAGSPAQLAALADRDRQIGELTGKIGQLRQQFTAQFLNSGMSKLPAEAQTALLAAPATRTEDQKKLVVQHTKELNEEIGAALPDETKTAIADIEGQIRRLRDATPDLPRAYYLHEPSPTPPETHVLLRGKPTRPGTVAGPGVPVVLVSQQPAFLVANERTTHRRLSLARWLADPHNALTARVIVNRIWQFHFGEGLVRTPSDFGVMGDPPTHPELLDYLAGEFVRHGWSFKWLHRLILTSNTYRMSKEWNAAYGRADPENRLWWRFPYRRMEVEAIRDSMLAVSGRLNPKMYGPPMFPFIPQEALAGNSDPDKIWPAYDEAEASRRTVYAFIKRSLVVPMIEVLDLCDTTKSSAKRAVTSVAPQALTLFNGRFVNEQAAHFARRLEREAGDDRDRQIEQAYRLALCRPPTGAEKDTMREFLATEAVRLIEESVKSPAVLDAQTARQKAVDQLCRVIFNLNEFVYPD